MPRSKDCESLNVKYECLKEGAEEMDERIVLVLAITCILLLYVCRAPGYTGRRIYYQVLAKTMSCQLPCDERVIPKKKACLPQ